MLSNLQDPRNLPRFPIKTWEKSVGTEQTECPMPSRQCQWHREKKALWTTTKNCTRKQSQNTMQVCLSCISLFGLGAHGKHGPVTHTRPVPLFIQPLPLSRRGLDSAVLPSYSCRNLYFLSTFIIGSTSEFQVIMRNKNMHADDTPHCRCKTWYLYKSRQALNKVEMHDNEASRSAGESMCNSERCTTRAG